MTYPLGSPTAHSPNAPQTRRVQGVLRVVAILEAAKGVLAFAAALGLLHLMHQDLHALALEFIGHWHWAADAHYPHLLIAAADRLQATAPMNVAVLFGIYIIVRMVEAYGLWFDRAWGAWFGMVSTGAYIPWELAHLWHQPTWQSATVVLINTLLVAMMAWRLRQKRLIQTVR